MDLIIKDNLVGEFIEVENINIALFFDKKGLKSLIIENNTKMIKLVRSYIYKI